MTRMVWRRGLVFLSALTCAVMLFVAMLAIRAVAADGDEEKPADPKPPAEYASPRDTLNTFFQNINLLEDEPSNAAAWQKVYGTLQMSRADGSLRQNAAWALLGVFNGLARIDSETMTPGVEEVERDALAHFEVFPDNPNDAGKKIFQPALDELGDPPGRIMLVRTDDGSWKFDSATLSNVNQMHSWIEKRGVVYGAYISEKSAAAALKARMPDSLKGRYFLTLEYWQWVGLLAIIFLSVVIDYISRFFLQGIVRRITKRYLGDPDEERLWYAVRPMGMAIGAITFLALVNFIGLTGVGLSIITIAVRVILAVGFAWAAWAITDMIAAVLLDKAAKTANTLDDMIIPLVRKTVKLFILALGILYVADSFDVSLLPLMGGLGVAGLAISFAAQDMVKNLFGGLTIFMDKPFMIGERIKFGGFDGSIEEIGFRTTKLRTNTGHLVTIPNGSITNDPVENVGRRKFIRRTMNVTITYDTPREKIGQAVQIIKDLLEEEGLREPIHGRIGTSEYPPRVYFNDYGAESLNIIVLYWFFPPAYWDYMDHAERFNHRLFEEYEQAGIEFAFPTQTLYLAGDPNRELTVKMLGESA